MFVGSTTVRNELQGSALSATSWPTLEVASNGAVASKSRP